MEEADRSLDLVRNSIERECRKIFSIDLMNAYENLGKILGESVGEDLVNEIFSKFAWVNKNQKSPSAILKE
ncbi:MAG: hypothetical protein ACLRWM_04635 [Streptococcus sp.]